MHVLLSADPRLVALPESWPENKISTKKVARLAARLVVRLFAFCQEKRLFWQRSSSGSPPTPAQHHPAVLRTAAQSWKAQLYTGGAKKARTGGTSGRAGSAGGLTGMDQARTYLLTHLTYRALEAHRHAL